MLGQKNDAFHAAISQCAPEALFAKIAFVGAVQGGTIAKRIGLAADAVPYAHHIAFRLSRLQGRQGYDHRLEARFVPLSQVMHELGNLGVGAIAKFGGDFLNAESRFG